MHPCSPPPLRPPGKRTGARSGALGFLLIVAGVFVGCRPSTTPPPTTSSTGDPDGWKDWVSSVEQEFLATGACPTQPPDQVAMLDGTMVEPDLVVLGDADLVAEGEYNITSYGYTFVDLATTTASGFNSCDHYFNFMGASGDGDIGLGFGAIFHSIVVPPFFESSLNAHSLEHPFSATLVRDVVFDGESITVIGYAVSQGGDGSYMWLCMDAVHGPEDYFIGPAEWSGSVFVHVEKWFRDSTTPLVSLTEDPLPPKDFFFRIGTIDCAYGEDASMGIGDCYNWSERDCDGIDNDLDGVIDEGSLDGLDADGNGVPDCMDDWDGDGIPNADDEDLDHGICDDF